MMTFTAEPGVATAPAPWDIKQLLCADAFSHPTSKIELRETHLSWVVLTGSFAYKIKKPVRLDFIDASTLSQRRHFCNEELRLNQRLAANLYVKVVTVSLHDGHARVGMPGGHVVDYAVCMRQFDGENELAALLESEEVALSEVTDLAEKIALFHMSAPTTEHGYHNDRTEQTYDTVFTNLASLISNAQDIEPLPALDRLHEWTHQQARQLEPFLNLRARSGCIRECHGDLHSRNIVRWKDRLLPFDCIEFDPRLRWIDVLSDLSFLVMDLVSHDREDLATALLSKYLEITGDYDGVRVLPFYAVYRALVRAKVDAISIRQSSAHAEEFRQRLRRRVQTAVEWLDRPRPMLILMHGASGSGKSWLSERLVPNFPALRIRSDIERKRFVRSVAQPAGPCDSNDLYAPDVTHRTYARLLECAESVTQAGFSAIVDATFLNPIDRELFHGLARRLQCAYAIVSCHADTPTLTQRIEARAREAADPSDADRRVLAMQLNSLLPFPEDERPDVIFADTRDPLVVRHVTSALQSKVSSLP